MSPWVMVASAPQRGAPWASLRKPQRLFLASLSLLVVSLIGGVCWLPIPFSNTAQSRPKELGRAPHLKAWLEAVYHGTRWPVQLRLWLCCRLPAAPWMERSVLSCTVTAPWSRGGCEDSASSPWATQSSPCPSWAAYKCLPLYSQHCRHFCFGGSRTGQSLDRRTKPLNVCQPTRSQGTGTIPRCLSWPGKGC